MCSVIGSSSWNQFQQMARYINDAPLFAYEAARILSSLGHLELLLDPDTMRPRGDVRLKRTGAGIP